ncbi:large conductance mechanosensitive channel [Kineothrix alysoides]|uniref:Large-conductance mechanosensitive channel n=1 Tax=Kineothrix alysoides TaxID=1469948 RepID=A0A4R1QQ96_9FIRM|nr:large conductance mechanosensitive channel protein MscL [Kineothrix alysoides]TCL55928.1 large conductance mechanosensitive channel [Kineothrix alysoides]
MKNFFNEFKAFISKGNVMNLAVGVIIGAAFQGVVTSLTDNILSPIIGLFAGQNFDLLKLEVFGVTIAYGAFLTSLVNFIIMAFVIFLIVKLMNKLLAAGKKPEEQAQAPATKKCPYCYSDIHTEATRCPSCTSQLGQ